MMSVNVLSAHLESTVKQADLLSLQGIAMKGTIVQQEAHQKCRYHALRVHTCGIKVLKHLVSAGLAYLAITVFKPQMHLHLAQ